MARRGPPGGRLPAVKVRSTRRRKPSSTRWLSRQLNDPYVAEAHRLGYRLARRLQADRARPALSIAAAWPPRRRSRLRARRLDAGRRRAASLGTAIVVGVDLAGTALLTGATFFAATFATPPTLAAISTARRGPADVVLSDMAPAATGRMAATDHLRIVALAEDAFAVAAQILKPGGAFVGQSVSGGRCRGRCSPS